MSIRKWLLALLLVAFLVPQAYASQLDTLKSTWEQSLERATQANRENPAWTPVWSRMQRTQFAQTASATALPEGYNPNGEILPFMKIVANNSDGRVRYESMGTSYRGVEIPLAIVGYPKAPRHPGEIGERIVIRWMSSIHGNENDGTEAALIFLREAAQGKWDSLLKDVVLLVSPAGNPDGKNFQTREIVDPYTGNGPGGQTGNTGGVDPNRYWSKASAVEIQAVLKLYRTWDPHIVIDHHNIGSSGIRRHRHIVTYANGKWGNNDPESDRENTAFAEGMFGQGIGKYKVANSYYSTFLRKFIDDYSPGNTAGNPVYALSNGWLTSENNSFSPLRNKDLSLISMTYTEDMRAQQVTRAGVTNWEVISFLNPIRDSVRGSVAVPTGKNRFAILMEVVSDHHTFLKVNAMHASVVSAIDLCQQRKNEVFEFFRRKDAEYTGLNNNSPAHLTTVYQGAISYHNGTSTSGRPNANGGNEDYPFRKVYPLKGYDHGWGPETFRMDGHFMPNETTVNRWQDYQHYPRVLLNNMPQYPIKMGAFYVMDPRATEAAQLLMMHGIEVYRLKEDVSLDYRHASQFLGPSRNPIWGITKNRVPYIGVLTTKMPRPRAEIMNQYSTEANAMSLDYTYDLNGVPWIPLTEAQMPELTDAPENGGGDWFEAPVGTNIIAKKGYFVIPTAQKWARYAGFFMEPRSNCGLLFWAAWDSVVGGTSRGDVDITGKFNLELIKTFDYTAIPKSALTRLYLPGEGPLNPENFEPPYKGQNLNNIFKDEAGATIVKAPSVEAGTVTVTIRKSNLKNGDWLLFYFYPTISSVVKGDPIAISAQVFETNEAGVFSAELSLQELKEKGIKDGTAYAITYINETLDIHGHGTFKTALKISGDGDCDCILCERIGCNTGYLAIALLPLAVFLFRRK